MLFKKSDLFKKSELKRFTKCGAFWHYLDVSAKSLTERGNSNNKTLANSSTPFNRAFFVRKVRTPKINPVMDLFSMVACDWQRLIVGCIPMFAVFHPVARYRPKAWKLLAVTLININIGVTQMIYQFLGISRQHYDRTKAEQIRIQADNEQQARAYLARNYVLVLLGRLPNSAKNDRTLEVKGSVYA
ncbi:host cell division inhibitor Icd-like protein [Pasteurella multocida]|uniref:host cell division inhibitor Icd-like protein n=1 Tax=Pasteurella multocida TaxID=747 RepID=UPI00099AAEEE|nr:host cell division inhibitor Icd-like protein [Pasteurella multocida]ARA70146.1 Ash-like/host cell division inhibitor Icd-like protein [Pasteurella multocida subsp. multocida]ARA89771.1 Ash-like/host cell division inhibitor Icd-like protein [Pasteurella multocida subsp. septica]MBE7392952.1 ash family protein [Pasteurella multocida]MCL7755707.1 host cell division inhibitor Icd-like protein [Pasteurella multocida]MCL7759510.1 host cell division inhibitor Icd-like protein [Pasteurella multoci